MSDWGADPVVKGASDWGHDPIVTAPGAAGEPKAKSGMGSIADEAHEAAQGYRQDMSTALDETGQEFTDPAHFPQHFLKGTGAALSAVGDAGGYAMSLATGPVKASLEQMGVSPKTARKVTDVLSMAVPIAGEANEARLVAQAAKEAGVSVRAMQGTLDGARQASLSEAATKKPALEAAKTKQSAAQRLILKGQLGSKEAAQKLVGEAKERREVGAGEPKLLDVLPKPAQKVVRKAGEESPEAGAMLREHQEATDKAISGRATERTEGLTPYKESISERKKGLTKERQDRAETMYKEPYAAPLQADEHLFSILNEKSGSSAIARALSTAKERSFAHPESEQQVRELQSLRDYSVQRAQYEEKLKAWEAGEKGEFKTKPNAQALDYMNHPDTSESVKDTIRKAHGWVEHPKPEPPEMPTLSGGTLDRVRIALRDSSTGLKENPKTHAEGVAISERAEALGKYMDDVPHLKEARADYRDYSERLRQLDFDQDLSTMRPEEFKRSLKDLSPEQRQERVKAVAERLAEGMGKSSSGVKGAESIMTTGRNAQENLRELLGKDVADKYMRAMELMQRGAEKADYAAGGAIGEGGDLQKDVAATGAKVGLLGILGSHHYALWEAMRFIGRHNGGLNVEQEGRQIAEWALDQKDVEKTLQEIADAADPVKRSRSKLPADILAKIPAKPAADALGAAAAADPLRQEEQPDQ